MPPPVDQLLRHGEADGTDLLFTQRLSFEFFPVRGIVRPQDFLLRKWVRVEKLILRDRPFVQQLLRDELVLDHWEPVFLRQLVFVDGGKSDFEHNSN